jgi:hypothetical protein
MASLRFYNSVNLGRRMKPRTERENQRRHFPVRPGVTLCHYGIDDYFGRDVRYALPIWVYQDADGSVGYFAGRIDENARHSLDFVYAIKDRARGGYGFANDKRMPYFQTKNPEAGAPESIYHAGRQIAAAPYDNCTSQNFRNLC